MNNGMVHAGLDESGSLTADSSHFCMVVVIAPHPLALRHIIHRAAARSGKRLGRPIKDAAEIKWNNASQRIRALALAGLADAHVELFALRVRKRISSRVFVMETPDKAGQIGKLCIYEP